MKAVDISTIDLNYATLRQPYNRGVIYDLNADLRPGFYCFTSGVKNAPEGYSIVGGMLIHMVYGQNTMSQTVFLPDPKKVFVRFMLYGIDVWTNWKEIG